MSFTSLKLAYRSLLKGRLTSGLNILGMAIGICIALLIFSFVRKEKTMDYAMPESENIYLLKNWESTHASTKMVGLIRQSIPEIQHITYCNTDWSPQTYIEKGNNKFKIDNLLVADSAFFKVFEFEPVCGNLRTALDYANQIVLTESLAKKLFGDEDPIGKQVNYYSTYVSEDLLTVGAVIKDISHRQSWKFDAVISIQTNFQIPGYLNNMNHWGSQNYMAYFKLPPEVDTKNLLDKLKNIPQTSVPEGMTLDFGFTPYRSCYFDEPNVSVMKHGNALTLFIVQMTGILILLMACANYILLVTAQRERRLKMIGIVKAMGSGRRKIVRIMTLESILTLSISVILVVAMSQLLISSFNYVTNSVFTFGELFQPENIIFLLIAVIIIVSLTGIIPGIILSSHDAKILLRKQVKLSGKSHFRNVLMVFQFSLTIGLIASVMIVKKQYNYVVESDPGFQQENIIYATTNDQLATHVNAFNNEVLSLSSVKDITYASAVIGYSQGNWGRALDDGGLEKSIHFANYWVSPGFFKFFGLDLVEGESFNEFSLQNTDFIFNQAAIKEFGIENITQARVIMNEPDRGNVIGVVEDFNFESLHLPIRTAGFMSAGNTDEVVYIKLQNGSPEVYENCLADLKEIWNRYSPNFPLEVSFLDSKWDDLYKKDKQFQSILDFATIVSIVLSCLGLVSMTFFIVEARTKEIGVRKINGAGVGDIVRILTFDLLKRVAIAFGIVCPLVWYAMHKWLESFAYKTGLSWWVFALAGLMCFVIAILTVSWQSWKAATRNPVESLRYE